jgi:hypothetical protein
MKINPVIIEAVDWYMLDKVVLLDYAKEIEPIKCTLAGYLLAKTPKKIVVAMEVFEDPEEGTNAFRHIISIPASCVKKVRRLT